MMYLSLVMDVEDGGPFFPVVNSSLVSFLKRTEGIKRVMYIMYSMLIDIV